MTLVIREMGNGRIKIEGRVCDRNAGDALDEGFRLIRHLDEVSIDIVNAEFESSVGLAVLLEWATVQRASGKHVVYINATNRLRKLVRVNDVQQLLNLRPSEDEHMRPSDL